MVKAAHYFINCTTKSAIFHAPALYNIAKQVRKLVKKVYTEYTTEYKALLQLFMAVKFWGSHSFLGS